MSSKLPIVPHKMPISDDGKNITRIWADWCQKVFMRTGGSTASTNTELQTQIDAQILPPGVMFAYGGTAAPTGFLLCNGAAVSRTTYAALFAIVGTAFGVGDGSTTFNLPASGKFHVSKDSGTFTTLGATGGAETAALPNHIHSVSITTGAPSATIVGIGAGTAVATATHTHAVTGNTGNPTTNPTVSVLPPYEVVNRIIKT